MRQSIFMVLLCLTVVCLPATALANDPLGVGPIESLETVLGYVDRDTMVRVKGAQVAYINYGALRRDFPRLRTWTNKRIERWVLSNFAYVTRTQLLLNNIRHTPIPVDWNDTKKSYHPPIYGRAALMTDETGQVVVDCKGTGLQLADQYNRRYIPLPIQTQQEKYWQAIYEGDEGKLSRLRDEDHSNGVLAFGKANAEVFRETAARKLFDLHNAKHKTNYRTVESYFVIALPATLYGDRYANQPLAIYGRQTHVGRADEMKVPEEIYIDPGGFRQRSFTNSAVDWGGVRIRDERLVRDFGSKQAIVDTGNKVAKAFLRGDSTAVYRRLEKLLAPIAKQWASLPTANQERRFEEPTASRKIYRHHLGVERKGYRSFLRLLATQGNSKQSMLSNAALQLQASGEVKYPLMDWGKHDEGWTVDQAIEWAEARVRNIDSLGDHVYEANSSQRDRIAKLIERALSRGSSYAISWAGNALSKLGGKHAARLIPKYINNPDPNRRAAVVEALGSQTGVESMRLLKRALDDPHPDIARRARWALTKRRDAAARTVIAEKLYQPEKQDPELLRNLTLKIVSQPRSFAPLIARIAQDPTYPDNAVKRTCTTFIKEHRRTFRQLRRQLPKFF